MRKQVDFTIRVITLAANPESYGGMKPEQLSAWVRSEYLQHGWEVINSERTQTDANSVSFALSLAKYEDESTPTAKK